MIFLSSTDIFLHAHPHSTWVQNERDACIASDLVNVMKVIYKALSAMSSIPWDTIHVLNIVFVKKIKDNIVSFSAIFAAVFDAGKCFWENSLKSSSRNSKCLLKMEI